MIPLPTIPDIKFKSIPGYNGIYCVGDDGSVWSAYHPGGRGSFRSSYRPLKLRRSNNGRFLVILCKNGMKKTCWVHRLILETFIGPCPNGHQCCHYPDRDVTNNHLLNLRWDTHIQNKADQKRHGTGNAKLTKIDVLEIRRLHTTGNITQRKIAVLFDIGFVHVSNIINRKRWMHI